MPEVCIQKFFVFGRRKMRRTEKTEYEKIIDITFIIVFLITSCVIGWISILVYLVSHLMQMLGI